MLRLEGLRVLQAFGVPEVPGLLHGVVHQLGGGHRGTRRPRGGDPRGGNRLLSDRERCFQTKPMAKTSAGTGSVILKKNLRSLGEQTSASGPDLHELGYDCFQDIFQLDCKLIVITILIVTSTHLSDDKASYDNNFSRNPLKYMRGSG